MYNFKNIITWQKARALVKEVYLLLKKFPKSELHGLVSQIMRSVVSIPSNIAEGSCRTTGKEFSRFLDIALASSFEMETQLILSYDLDYISEQELKLICVKTDEVQKLVQGFKKLLKQE